MRRRGAHDEHSEDARAVVTRCYESLLGRAPDPDGLEHYVGLIGEGMNPADVAIAIAQSEEYKQRVASVPRRRRPERYRTIVDTSGNDCLVFDAHDASDFDWLEHRIVEDGYYERAGVWSLDLDDDKREMADIVASFTPRRALELGCSAGAVVAELRRRGIDAEGVDISKMAFEHAPDDVRDYLHLGDVLDLALPDDYDVVCGLDVFEHLNPNRLDAYLAAVRARLAPGGHVFAVVPAFGFDEVFGEVFPPYLDEWRADIDADRLFRAVFCDDGGYPLHGHLVNAPTTWWVDRFRSAGFERRPAIEREIHEAHARHFEIAPARRSFYVFA
jgi:SAM-dependent methyltransferase